MRWKTRYLLFGSALAALAANAPRQQRPEPRIVVGPNILVSRNGDAPHYEVMMAVNPRDPSQMLIGSIAMARPAGGQMNKGYVSGDGGFTWTDFSLPEGIRSSSGDPQVAFSARGTPIFTALTFNRPGPPGVFLHVYRSSDAGEHWDPPANLGGSYDHEMIAVDRTAGRFAHRMYLGALYGPYPRYIVGIFRSDDDGKTWIGPVKAAEVPGIGINVTPLLVLSDGTLIVTMDDFEHEAEKRKKNGDKHMWLTMSTDGGITFAEPWKVMTQKRDALGEDIEEIRGTSVAITEKPSWAVDNKSDRFRDRVYLTWADISRGKMRVFVSSSSDRGRTWAPTMLVSPDVPAAAAQFHPTVAVNDSGVVGISWFDTRQVPDGTGFDEYFAASVDGGATFLAPARVSSASSWPRGTGNLTPSVWSSATTPGGIRVSLQSAYSFRTSVGDYIGLATDPRGTFHAAWPDSRSGTAQIYVGQITVTRASHDVPAGAVAADVTTRLSVVADPARYDSVRGEVQLPLRLRNTSRDTLYPPLSVEVRELGDLRDTVAVKGAPQPTIVNASNGKTGAGAVFDFTPALRDWRALPPGAVTEAVVVRLQTRTAHHTATPLVLRVTGRMRGKN